MKEDTIELIDHLTVLWRRKALIIIVTLTFSVIAAIIYFLSLEIYKAEAFMSIGMRFHPSTPTPTLTPLNSPVHIAMSIPVEYSPRDEEVSQYILTSEVVDGTSLIKISVEGPNRRKAEEILEGLIKKITEDHLRRTEASLQPYQDIVEKLTNDSEKIYGEIILAEKKIEMINYEKEDLTLVITAQNYLLQEKAKLREMQQNLLIYQSFIQNIDEYKTKVIGKIQTEQTRTKREKKRNILLAGVVGFMTSFFLVFFLEYLDKKKIREIL